LSWAARRRAENRDTNEPEIIAALEAVHATVCRWDAVDLIVGFRRENFLLEVKRPGMNQRKRGKRQQMTNDKQAEFRRTWAGQVEVVETPEDALEAIGAV